MTEGEERSRDSAIAEMLELRDQIDNTIEYINFYGVRCYGGAEHVPLKGVMTLGGTLIVMDKETAIKVVNFLENEAR